MKGFDAGVFGELLFKPEFGNMASMTAPAVYFAFLFFLATALFLPGILSGYASTYRLPREEFFRACGRKRRGAPTKSSPFNYSLSAWP